MAGVDAELVDAFSRVNGKNNMQVIGVHYEGIENLSLSTWYYRLKDADIDSIAYAEVSYAGTVDTLGYEIGIQYAKQTYTTTDDASVYGVSTSVEHTPSGVSLGFAYNKADGNAAFSGFGGGPFFSNSEYLIIDNAGKDGSQSWIGAAFDASVLGAKGLTLSLGYATLKDKTNAKATELDFVMGYEVNKHIEMHLIASNLKGSKLGEDDAKHLRVFLNYNF